MSYPPYMPFPSQPLLGPRCNCRGARPHQSSRDRRRARSVGSDPAPCNLQRGFSRSQAARELAGILFGKAMEVKRQIHFSGFVQGHVWLKQVETHKFCPNIPEPWGGYIVQTVP